MNEIPPEILNSAPIELLFRALTALELSGKCEIVSDTSTSGQIPANIEAVGVKFFP